MEYSQSFLDASPSKGVIVVEYFWQPHSCPQTAPQAPGKRASMVSFRRILASEECWCGSRRRFARCHRRDDDWTFVTLDPGQGAHSPIVLLECTFARPNPTHIRELLNNEPGLLPFQQTDSLAEWGVPIEPTFENEFGRLILGTVGVSQDKVQIETNSEKRFAYLTDRFKGLLGGSAAIDSTIRVDPQHAFPLRLPSKRSKKRQA